MQLQFEALGTKCRATAMQVVLALWAALLMKQASQDAVVVGFATANRNHHLIHDLIGCFINTIAVPVAAGTNDPLHAVVEGAAHAVQGALAHSWTPFHDVVAALKNRDTSSRRMPIYQTMCMWEDNLFTTRPSTISWARSAPNRGSSRWPLLSLSYTFIHSPDSDFVGTIKYNPDLHQHQLCRAAGTSFDCVSTCRVNTP